MARKVYCEPYYRWYSSLEECTSMALAEAEEAQVIAAVNFFNEKCSIGGPMHEP